jgi:hypothetical protein
MRRRVGSILLLLQLLTTVAIAQPAPDAAPAMDADDREAVALAHQEAGIAAYRAGDYAVAHDEFARASAAAPDKANPYRWLARTEAKLGDCAGVRVNAGEFLARVPPDDPRAPEVIQLRVACDHAAGPATPVPSSTPVTRTWWFWTAVIGGAAVVAGAVVLLASGGGENEYPPILCNASGCTP